MIVFAEYPIASERCDHFEITVNGKKTNAIKTRVSAMPFNRPWPGKQRPLEQTEIASYLPLFTDEQRLEFTITPADKFEKAVIRPISAGVVPQIKGGKIQFTIQKTGYYTVELDGPHNALHLFIDPLHHFGLPQNNASVYYFGPGVHNVGELRVKSGTTVYIHRDAVVYGSILGVNVKNVKILGEGVLDGSFYERKTTDFLLGYDYSRVPEASWEKQQMKNICDENSDCFTDISAYQKGSGTFICRDDAQFDRLLKTMHPVQTGISLYASENIEVTGIIIRNCAGLSVTQAGCRNIHYKNVKLIGMWRYNSDGIDFYNCQNCSVRKSFLRTFDDTICVKGQVGWDTANSSDILIEDCVLWNDWGHTLDIGVDTVAPEICNIVFRNCDLIHSTGTAMDVGNADRAHIHNILFENLRIEFSQYDLAPVIQSDDETAFTPKNQPPALIKMFLNCGVWSIDGMYGNIENVTFKNIAVCGDAHDFRSFVYLEGRSSAHCIKNVIFQNISYNGKPLATPDALRIKSNEFADFRFL